MLQGVDIGLDLIQGAHGRGPVEVACEGDFIAHQRLALVDPGIRGIGQHLATEERLDAAVFQQWYRN